MQGFELSNVTKPLFDLFIKYFGVLDWKGFLIYIDFFIMNGLFPTDRSAPNKFASLLDPDFNGLKGLNVLKLDYFFLKISYLI